MLTPEELLVAQSDSLFADVVCLFVADAAEVSVSGSSSVRNSVTHEKVGGGTSFAS